MRATLMRPGMHSSAFVWIFCWARYSQSVGREIDDSPEQTSLDLHRPLHAKNFSRTSLPPAFGKIGPELEDANLRKVIAGLLLSTNAAKYSRSKESSRINSKSVSMMARKLRYGGKKYQEKVFIKRGPIKGVSRPSGRFDSSTLKQGVDVQVRNLQGLRITGGDRRNMKIETPSAYMRPMMSRVREAFFSMIRGTNVIRPSASCIDFFSGAGTCGFEALSRGIGNATMVDFSETCASVIRDNAEKLDFEDRSRIVQASVEDVIRNPQGYGITKPFDLVMLTPPYEEVVYSELMTAVARSDIVAPNTIVMVEYPIELGSLPSVLSNGNLIGYRNRRYGRTVLAIYVYRPAGNPFDDFEQHPEDFIEQNWK